MRMRTLVATAALAFAAALAGVAAASSASAAVATPADCVWHGGQPICVPNQ